MLTLITNSGREIPCDAIVPASQYPVLHIHTHAIGGAEAWTIFSDPAETCRLIRRDDDGETVFTGFTRLYSVQSSPFVPGDILIWLNYDMPAQRAEEAHT